jgi:hypothetical protein
MTNRKRRILIISFVAIFSILFILFIGLPLLFQYICRPIFITPLSDPSPLAQVGYNAEPERMEDFLDVKLFENHEVIDRPDAGGVKFFEAELDNWPEGNHHFFPRITIYITLHESISMARWSFDNLCIENGSYDPHRKVYLSERSGDDRYCVFYMEEFRVAPDSGCGRTGEYLNYAIFQKGRAIITIDEYTNDRNSVVMNEVFSLIGQAISAKAQLY